MGTTTAVTAAESPRLSVVIAAFNAAGTIAEQLSALVAQRPSQPWEILVCDNGSTDETRELVGQWARRHPDIRLVDASRRRGPAAARNIGVASSSGDWIAFCDADDVVGEGWVRAVTDSLQEHPFVAGRFSLTRFGGARFAVSWSPQLEGLSVVHFLPGFVTAGAGNMAMHRTVFDAVGGFEESALAAEDDDFCLRAQLTGFPLTFDSEMVLHVRQRTGLRAVYRQARAYGIGAHRLRHRYSAFLARPPAPPSPLARATSAAQTKPSDPAAQAPTPAAQRARVGSRIANAVWRAGWRWGWLRAPLGDVDQIVRPAIQR